MPTRYDKVLDQCYCTIANAFHAVAWAPLGQSDHNTVFLIPVYRQKLKSVKTKTKVVKQWSSQAICELKDCFDNTDWAVFKESCCDLNEFAEVVNSYINFAENVCVPTKSVTVYSNNKPWFSREIKHLWKNKHNAYKSGDKDLYKVAKYDFERAVNKAKADYRHKLESKLEANDNRGVWEGLRQITGYTSTSPVVKLPDSLNEFYCRFDRDYVDNITQSMNTNTPSPPFVIEEDEVRLLLRKQNCRKAAGPDLVSSATIKHCADELAPVLTDIFNWSLRECTVPQCFKSAVIIPVPKKSMLQFYRATIESVLTFSITVWYGNSTVQQRAQLDRIVNIASKIIGCKLSPICEIYEARIFRKGLKILQDDTHPANSLFSILPSGRRMRSIKTKTSRFLNSTYCRAIKSLNSSQFLDQSLMVKGSLN